MKNFKLSEFNCPCCGANEMDSEFLLKLDLARSSAETPFIITSGYRCEKHNKEVGGVPNSAHTRGKAADILVTTATERYKILKSLLAVGFNRIGIGSNFIHVDTDNTKEKYKIWGYYK